MYNCQTVHIIGGMISGQPLDLERNKSVICAKALMSVIMP